MKKLFILVIVTISTSVFGQQEQSKIMNYLGSGEADYIPYKNSIDSGFAKCDSTWRTNVEWGECLGEHEELWNKLMLQFYDSLMSELDTAGKKLLKSSQTNWTNNVNAQSEFWEYFESFNYFGRDGHFKAYYIDLFITRSRAVELRAYLEVFREIKKDKKDNADKK